MVAELHEFHEWVTFPVAQQACLQENAARLPERVAEVLAAERDHFPPLLQEDPTLLPWLEVWLVRLCAGRYDEPFWKEQIAVGERLTLLGITFAHWESVLRLVRERILQSFFAQCAAGEQEAMAQHFFILIDGCQYAIHLGYLQQKDLDLLAEIRALTRIYQLEDFFAAAADVACTIGQAQGAGLILCDGEQLQYRLFHGLSASYQQLDALSFPKEQGVAGEALRTGKVIFEHDYAQNPQAMPEFVTVGLQGSLALPLPGPEGPQGVVVLSWFSQKPPARIAEVAWEYLHLLADLLGAFLYRERLEKQLHQVSTRDVLTGLPNRRVVFDRLHATMARSVRQQKLFALCFLDLDGFKVINDQLGHHRGDAVLREVADRLRTALRAEDTAIRYAGDEFVLIIEDIGHVSEVERLTERVLQAVRFRVEDRYPISASMGTVIYPFDEGSPEELLQHADQAMYVAKERGGNCWVPYGHYLQDTLQAEQTVLQDLRIALAQREFLLYWQPIVSLPEQQIVGVEALLRWQHPTQGLLAPGAFLETLERSSLMDDVGQWIVSTAVAQAERWHQSGHELDIHINLSGQELRNPHWIDWCAACLAQFPQVQRQRLHFEIVERVTIEDLPIVAKQIRAAQKQLGIQFVLDDFGTGASALQHLGELDCSGIKIDQSMVRDLLKNGKHVHLVRGLLHLAKSLMVDAVAEGVETEELAQLLAEIGVEKAQGYYFSKPVPVQELDALL